MTTSTKKIQASFSLTLTGDENQTVQIVLGPQKKVISHLSNLVWMSEKLHVLPRKISYLTLVQPSTQLVDISNISSSPAAIGFSIGTNNGNCYVIEARNFKPDTGFYCFKDCFVCATEHVEIVSKSLPVQYPVLSPKRFISNKLSLMYLCKFSANIISDAVILQCGSLILEKQLSRGESFYVAMTSIVGCDDSCQVAVHDSFDNGFRNASPSSIMLKFDGPGKVYFSSCITNRAIGNSSISKTQRLMTLLLGFSTFLLVFTMIYFATILNTEQFLKQIEAIVQGREI